MNATDSIKHKPDEGPRILIINLHSSCNLGDHALTETAIDLLKKKLKDCVITLAMNDPDSFPNEETVVSSFMHTLRKVSQHGRVRWQIGKIIWTTFSIILAILIHRISRHIPTSLIIKSQRPLLVAYRDADIILSAPGNYLYSSGKVGLPFLIAIFSISIAHYLGKPIYLLPQSIGPISRRWESWLIMQVISRSRITMLRESTSLSIVKEQVFKSPQCILVPDIAFAFRTHHEDAARKWLGSNGVQINDGRPSLGVTVVDLDNLNFDPFIRTNYEQAIAGTIEKFIKQYDFRVVFFAHTSGSRFVADDRIPSERILSLIPDYADAITLIDRSESASIQKSSYGLMDLFLGTRMHSNIFAMAEGVPSLAIAYFPKTKGIMQMVGMEEWIIDLQDIETSYLNRRLQALWEERVNIRGKLEATLPEYALKAATAIDLVADDYKMMHPISNND
ncbi:MAG: polysaccharide pyruvyl transferase family protein [Candidatus Hermodarchaeia archaeon]|jgi:colanic acid/amylovoran biosynthesis protein